MLQNFDRMSFDKKHQDRLWQKSLAKLNWAASAAHRGKDAAHVHAALPPRAPAPGPSRVRVIRVGRYDRVAEFPGCDGYHATADSPDGQHAPGSTSRRRENDHTYHQGTIVAQRRKVRNRAWNELEMIRAARDARLALAAVTV